MHVRVGTAEHWIGMPVVNSENMFLKQMAGKIAARGVLGMNCCLPTGPIVDGNTSRAIETLFTLDVGEIFEANISHPAAQEITS